jgi:tetratricopeptide (TPR) repeat protein
MQTGKVITQKDDLLRNISPEDFFSMIKSPEPEMAALIQRMRLIRSIDQKQYGLVKRQLPYIVCGVFNPPYRKIENFGYCEYFMVDIDHIGEKDLSVATIKSQLIQDSRVMLCFVSPSEDGLKVLFRLSEKCYDSGKYSLFYKCFVQAFSVQYGLKQVIDTRTSDISRACFLSCDPDAYYNAGADAVRMSDFIDFDNPFEYGKTEQILTANGKETPKEPHVETPKGPDADALAFIKEKLNARKGIVKSKPQVYVPEQLEQILEKLLEYINESGVKVEETVNISYGKKFKLSAGILQAEVNLFFGKKGFSVVKSPRQGTSEQLNELMAAYIQSFIGDYILLKEDIVKNLSRDKMQEGEANGDVIRQQALLMFTEKNYREALPLYRMLWESYPDSCGEWEGWRYAYCAQQLKDYKTALDICRKLYAKCRNFSLFKTVYAWVIYHSEINKEKIADEATFFHAGEGILKLSQQNDKYSPYITTVFKVLNYLSGKSVYRADKMLEWTEKLNPAGLDANSFSVTDREGNSREIASRKEQYYMLRTRALLESGEFDECIKLCGEALATFDKLHYGNEIWFRWRIGLSYEGLGEFEKSLQLQLELLKMKKEWFIQKEIAEQYYRLGNYEKSLQYALDSALNAGDADKKINTYICLANVLEKLGKVEEAQLHVAVVEKLRQKNQPVDDEIKKLKTVWHLLKYSSSTSYSGIIKSILPNGKAGFVETDMRRTYYFSMRNFKGKPEKALPGLRVTFYLEEGFDVKKNKKTMNAVNVCPERNRL